MKPIDSLAITVSSGCACATEQILWGDGRGAYISAVCLRSARRRSHSPVCKLDRPSLRARPRRPEALSSSPLGPPRTDEQDSSPGAVQALRPRAAGLLSAAGRWGGRSCRRWLGHDERPPLGGGSEHAGVPDRMKPRRRDEGDQPTEQRERVQVDRHGAVAERLLQRDAHESIGPGRQPPLGRECVLVTIVNTTAYALNRTIQAFTIPTTRPLVRHCHGRWQLAPPTRSPLRRESHRTGASSSNVHIGTGAPRRYAGLCGPYRRTAPRCP
jgi:hypothetical protein